MSADRMSLETLSRCEAVGLLVGATIGRVVFTVAALPAVVPVTFAVRDEAIVLRTSADTRLAVAADGGVLAFEVDEVDPQKGTGWSVVITGVAEVVTDPAQCADIRSAVVPLAPGKHEIHVRLPLTVVTGRRIADPALSGPLRVIG